MPQSMCYRYKAGRITACSEEVCFGTEETSEGENEDLFAYMRRMGFEGWERFGAHYSWLNYSFYDGEGTYILRLDITYNDAYFFRVEGVIDYLKFIRDYVNPLVEHQRSGCIEIETMEKKQQILVQLPQQKEVKTKTFRFGFQREVKTNVDVEGGVKG